MNAHAVSNRKRRNVTLVLFFLDGIDDLIHGNPFPHPLGGRTVSCRIDEIATSQRIIWRFNKLEI